MDDDPEFPMVPARPRDRPRLAWLMAREFARPNRRGGRVWWPVAVTTLPLYLVVALGPGVHHWRRRAVLVLHRPRRWWHIVKMFGLFVLVFLVAVVLLAVTPEGRLTLVLVGALLGVPALGVMVSRFAAWWAVRHRAREPQVDEPETVPGARPVARAEWRVTLVVAEPGLNAIDRIFEPFLLATVPAGTVVGATARNGHLLRVYQEKGFQLVDSASRKMVARVPARDGSVEA